MGKLPEGDLAPIDGRLPATTDRLAIYLHIPFCARRCGYCDFNTYTADELSRDGLVVNHLSYVDALMAEMALSRRVLGADSITVPSVFIGGGTPSLLDPALIAKALARVRDDFDLAQDCEITIEANPDSVTTEALSVWRRAGVNRISIGMQSAVPHVLTVLDRTHRPENVAKAVEQARSVGFEQISVDLIYGTPGESMHDWRASIESALSLQTDHISAYALIVEEGTKLAAQVQRGEIVMPDDDETAEKYELADQLLLSAGYEWYEVSNWSRSAAAQSRHNLAYWRSDDWWGFGPGAHSHVRGTRWWNVKHPSAYAQRLHRNESPAAARESLSEYVQRDEQILLQLRLREGLDRTLISAAAQDSIALWVELGHLNDDGERLVLTRSGRLLADAITRSLLS